MILAGCLIDFPSIFGQVSDRCFARFSINFSKMFDLLARFLGDCSGLWALGFELWALGSGLWALGFGLWALGSGL